VKKEGSPEIFPKPAGLHGASSAYQNQKSPSGPPSEWNNLKKLSEGEATGRKGEGARVVGTNLGGSESPEES